MQNLQSQLWDQMRECFNFSKLVTMNRIHRRLLDQMRDYFHFSKLVMMITWIEYIEGFQQKFLFPNWEEVSYLCINLLQLINTLYWIVGCSIGQPFVEETTILAKTLWHLLICFLRFFRLKVCLEYSSFMNLFYNYSNMAHF